MVPVCTRALMLLRSGSTGVYPLPRIASLDVPTSARREDATGWSATVHKAGVSKPSITGSKASGHCPRSVNRQ